MLFVNLYYCHRKDTNISFFLRWLFRFNTVFTIHRFRSKINIAGTFVYSGTFGTVEEAAVAWDREALRLGVHKDDLNYPLLEHDLTNLSLQKYANKPTIRNKTGYMGVCKEGRKFRAQIWIDGDKKYLGTFKTAKKAAIAYDREALTKKPQGKYLVAKQNMVFLNFPEGVEDEESSEEDEEYHQALNDRNTTGYRGVCKLGKKVRGKEVVSCLAREVLSISFVVCCCYSGGLLLTFSFYLFF